MKYPSCTSAHSAQEEVLQRPIVYEGSTVPIPRVKAWTPTAGAFRGGGRHQIAVGNAMHILYMYICNYMYIIYH
jgi:hypothetical protein